MEKDKYFRGDTILKEVSADNYKFQKGDVLKVSLMTNICDTEHAFDKTIEVPQEQDTIQIEIPPENTKKLDLGRYILEYELTTNLGIVSTTQEELAIEGDGIRE